MNYSVVKVIDPLSKPYKKIQELYLNHNLIESLTGIEQFTNLRIFHIKFNFIADLDEFLKISNKNILHSLNFIGNPVEAQLVEDPGFLNNFTNLRNFNASKETSLLFDSAISSNSNKITNGTLSNVNRKLHFLVDPNNKENIEEFENENNEEGLMTGNFKTNNQKIEANNENYVEDIQNRFPLSAHINNIDYDINRLSVIFYEKLLKEKTLLGLKRYFLQSYYRENRFSQDFYAKILINRGFWLWRKKFIEKLLLKSQLKSINSISQEIKRKSMILSEELSTSALVLRGKKQSMNYNLRRITETDQDFIDSNRCIRENEHINLNILKENIGEKNEQIVSEAKKIGFSEYKEISLKNAKNEHITEENYRHDLPLSTSFSSKCPYGSI